MLKEIQEDTGMTPKALQNRPIPREDCIQYREAFWLLSGARGFNEAGFQAIEVPAILKYCESFHFSVEETETYLRLIRAMDDIFLDHLRKKQEQARPK
jgi:hypothetical protein